MGKIVFNDSRAIKITSDMRNSLNSYNEKKHELELVNEELKVLEDSRKEKENELEGLNLKAMDSDKKIAKEASKKIKTIDKEISKIINDAKKISEKVNGLKEQEKPINMVGIVLKSFKDFGKEEKPVENKLPDVDNQINMPVIDDVVTPEITLENINNSFNDVQIMNDSTNVETEPITESAAEPIILEDAYNNIEVASEDESLEDSGDDLESELDEVQTSEIPMDEEIKDEKVSEKVINNNFLSEKDLDKMWDALNDNSNEDSIKNVPLENKETGLNEKVIENSDEKHSSKKEKSEIEKPDIFGEDSKFMKIASLSISPSPLLPEDNVTNLVPYSDYNDYVFKFGQDHYGKEALTPKEISDLASVKDFLDNDTFETERSNQYNNIEKENDELRNRITHLDEDYKKQVDDMKHEHTSNLNKLGKLIDKANNIIDNNKVRIDNLENKNADLNNTVKNQSEKIDSLNNKVTELDSTIDKLNDDIMELERIKQEQETKIKNYEDKFKEVLGIVREVKAVN